MYNTRHSSSYSTGIRCMGLTTFVPMYTLKKSLGQHFLTDENITRKIVQSIQQYPFTQLLEVGPGGGALTKYLIQIPAINFKAVELDAEKVTYLLATYPVLEGKIIHNSFLDIDAPFTGNFTIAGNFPYNISSQILFKILDWREQVEAVTGMFQKEVAQRVAAKPRTKAYGVLSILVQAFFDVHYLFDVHENCFNPPPKVKSGVIQLFPRKDIPPMKTEKLFFTVVKTAFNQRRKTLRNALKPVLPAAVLNDPFFNKRAEELSVEDFARLTFSVPS